MLFASFCQLLQAQGHDSLGEKQENYFRHNYDNDFFAATDRYYTQGVRLELILNPLKHNPLSRLFIKLRGAINYHGLAFQRDGFTPRSIRHDSIYYGERPYASVCFLSFFRISVDKERQRRLWSQLDLGVIGPNAKGEEEQKLIHEKLDNIQPLGWEYQVTNDAVINYSLKYEKGILMKEHLELIGSMEMRAGTLYDDLSIGSTVMIGWMKNYFDKLGLSKRNTKNAQFYLFVQERVRAVGYNATLQGGVFNKKSVYVLRNDEINRITGTAFIGIVLAYKRLSIEYAWAFITPEFRKGLSHSWGHCNISFCF